MIGDDREREKREMGVRRLTEGEEASERGNERER